MDSNDENPELPQKETLTNKASKRDQMVRHNQLKLQIGIYTLEKV